MKKIIILRCVLLLAVLSLTLGKVLAIEVYFESEDIVVFDGGAVAIVRKEQATGEEDKIFNFKGFSPNTKMVFIEIQKEDKDSDRNIENYEDDFPAKEWHGYYITRHEDRNESKSFISRIGDRRRIVLQKECFISNKSGILFVRKNHISGLAIKFVSDRKIYTQIKIKTTIRDSLPNIFSNKPNKYKVFRDPKDLLRK